LPSTLRDDFGINRDDVFTVVPAKQNVFKGNLRRQLPDYKKWQNLNLLVWLGSNLGSNYTALMSGIDYFESSITGTTASKFPVETIIFLAIVVYGTDINNAQHRYVRHQ